MNKRIRQASYFTRTTSALITLTAILGFQNLWAAEPEPGYEMSFVSNQAHGDLMEDGRYRLVIQLLSSNAHDPIATMTNRCVARTMIGERRHARRDCNRAVELSEEAVRSASESERDGQLKNLAVALSNRGVLRAIRNQNGAEEDFTRAIGLQVYPVTASRNLARLNRGAEERLVVQGEGPSDQG